MCNLDLMIPLNVKQCCTTSGFVLESTEGALLALRHEIKVMACPPDHLFTKASSVANINSSRSNIPLTLG